MHLNKKRWGLLLVWINTILFASFLVLFIISFYSNTLITSFWRYVLVALLVITALGFIWGLYLINQNRYVLKFRQWFMILANTGVSLYIVGCSAFLFILYGPYPNFKNWLITTAMATMNHQHYCKWFYSDAIIAQVMGENYVQDFDEDTDTSLVEVGKDVHYKNDYERQILEHNKDQLFKIIEFKVNDCNAYLAAVYDAQKISLAVTKWLGRSGQYIYDMATENDAVLAINGGSFVDPNHNSKGAFPNGVTIQNKKIISNDSGGSVIGFNDAGVLMLTQNRGAEAALAAGYRDAVTMSPLLIVNGNPAFIKGNGGWGYAARTAIGQREDGIVLFLVVDSNATRTKGASMLDLTQIMQRYGAINAANLDGGTSSVMVVSGKMINDPIDSAGRHQTRGIPTAFIVKK